MKLIRKNKIKETICPSGGYCRGESCSAFNRWYDWWETKLVPFKIDSQWWHYFRPIKFNNVFKEAFDKWEPGEIEDWEYIGKEYPWLFEQGEVYVATYRRPNPKGRWSCGLNSRSNQ